MRADGELRFLFRLALRMGRSVAELLHTVSNAELLGWWAFYQVEPWGCQVEDYRAAIVATTIASQWAKTPPKLADFMPRWGEDPRERTLAEDKAYFAALAKLSGGDVTTKGEDGINSDSKP